MPWASQLLPTSAHKCTCGLGQVAQSGHQDVCGGSSFGGLQAVQRSHVAVPADSLGVRGAKTTTALGMPHHQRRAGVVRCVEALQIWRMGTPAFAHSHAAAATCTKPHAVSSTAPKPVFLCPHSRATMRTSVNAWSGALLTSAGHPRPPSHQGSGPALAPQQRSAARGAQRSALKPCSKA